MVPLITSKHFGQITKQVGYQYVLHIPTPSEGVPLLVVLHGAGERSQNIDRHKLYLEVVPKVLLDQMYVLLPLCPNNDIFDPDGISFLIDQVLLNNKNIDPKRVYICGFSMGGRGVWDFISEYPHKIAAAMPISGFSCYLRAQKCCRVPIWCFHGEDDKLVPIEESNKMISSISGFGGNPKFTVLENCGHDPDILPWALDQSKVQEWLLSQTR